MGLYFATMRVAGYWGVARVTSAEDYLVAGRRLGPQNVRTKILRAEESTSRSGYRAGDGCGYTGMN
jgi:hypothetical protein